MPSRLARASVSANKSHKPRKRLQRRALDALSIASKQHPDRLRVRRSRLGEAEGEPSQHKRRRISEHDEEEEAQYAVNKQKHAAGLRKGHTEEGEIDTGSDSDGNQWTLGHVDKDNDSDVDSDEAFGASDEERFEGFIFRGSKSVKQSTSENMGQTESLDAGSVIDLNEEVDPGGVTDNEDALSQDEDAVDLATMLDESYKDANDHVSAGSPASNGNIGSATGIGIEADQSDDESDRYSIYSTSDGADKEDKDPSKNMQLQHLIASLQKDGSHEQSTSRATDLHETMPPSEYGVTASQKLKVEDLLATVTNPALRKSLKLLNSKPSKTNGVPRKLQPPLPKRQRDRLDREAAAKKAEETLGRWIDTVKHNRRAEHLSFPVKEQHIGTGEGTRRFVASTGQVPLNDLESTINSILAESGLGASTSKLDEDRIRAAEEHQANNLPLEEVLARRAELRRARDLMFREEIRAKRIKKIKSKAYRRIHRREREKAAQQERDAFIAAGLEMSEDERERNDRRRAEERMGAKHRNSKWARGVREIGRAAWDEDARNGLTDMAVRDEELRRRIQGKSVYAEESGPLSLSSEDDESEDGSDTENNEVNQSSDVLHTLDRLTSDQTEKSSSKLASMKFMKRAEANLKEQNEEDIKQIRKDLTGDAQVDSSEPEEESPIGRRVFRPTTSKSNDTVSIVKRNEKRNEFEEGFASDKDSMAGDDRATITTDTKAGKQYGKEAPSPLSRKNHSVSERQKSKKLPPEHLILEGNPWLVSAKASGSAPPVVDTLSYQHTLPAHVGSFSRISANGSFANDQQARNTNESHEHHAAGEDHDSDSESQNPDQGETRMPFVLRNQELVKKAFAGDEVVAEFEQEKKATVIEEDEKVIDNTLPGWGNWTGEGISKRAQKRNMGRFLSRTSGVKAEKRKDAKLEKVIISEKNAKKNAKYMASTLPHPFENRQQYERSLRLPVGPEWTTKETFFNSTKPRVMIKPNTIIPPLERPIL